MKRRFTMLAVAFAVVMTLASSSMVSAVNLFNNCTDANCSIVKDNKLDYTSSSNQIWNMVSFGLKILAGLAVIMIIVGGIRYATSAGESSKITEAKNTILYSVIGLVVALAATVIIAFVNNQFG